MVMPGPITTQFDLTWCAVLKTGGYKVSALDIERALLDHPSIAEAIVVGIDDAEFGQRVAAAVVLKEVIGPKYVIQF
jgi:acyl-coenzyme A synthetase/AMP-(fatty) acid ligase